jgi:zinc protease
MQQVEIEVLKNKMKVIFVFDHRFTTSSIQMNFKVGWRHDKKELLGLAHLFEHLVGKRTRIYPGKSEFAIELEKLGIESNAYTSFDYTAYYHNQTEKNLLPSLKMLFEALNNSVFNKEDLAMEKKVVMNERREALDNDDHLLWVAVVKNLFPESALTQDLFGTPETMNNISVSDLEKFYAYYLDVHHSFLVVASSDRKQKKMVLDFLNSLYEQKNFIKTNTVQKSTEVVLTKEKAIVKNSSIDRPHKEQANIRVAYKIEKLSTKERVTFLAMTQIFVGGFAGKFFLRLRDQLGLTYGIKLWRDSLVDFDYCVFECMCDKLDKEKLLVELELLVKNAAGSLVKKDVDNVLEMLYFKESKSQNPRMEAVAISEAEILKQDYIDSDSYVRLLEQVSVEDIKRMTEKIFRTQNKTVVILE